MVDACILRCHTSPYSGEDAANSIVEANLVRRLWRSPDATDVAMITLDLEYEPLNEMVAELGDLCVLAGISTAKQSWNKKRKRCLQLPRRGSRQAREQVDAQSVSSAHPDPALSQDGVVVRGEDAIPAAPHQKKGRCATTSNRALD